MIRIGDFVLERKKTMEETLSALRLYLNKNRVIIVDENDYPCSEEQIKILLGGDNVKLRIKTIVQLEKETIEESLEYIGRIERKINETIDCPNAADVFKWFPEIINAFLELQKIGTYFNSDIITMEKIDEIAKKGLTELEEKNDSYLRELIEYELQPLLVDFKEYLLRGKFNC